MAAGKWMVVTGALGAFLGVGFGAFGAHALRRRLDERMLSVWETAVQYHLVHAVALVLVGVVALRGGAAVSLHAAGVLMLLGMVLFSGSLYLLALTGARWLGPVTPVGGLCFMLAWLALAWAAVRAL